LAHFKDITSFDGKLTKALKDVWQPYL